MLRKINACKWENKMCGLPAGFAFFADVENPWKIEAKPDIAFAPFAGCLRDESIVCHALCVG